jgi:hypothetical protein
MLRGCCQVNYSTTVLLLDDFSRCVDMCKLYIHRYAHTWPYPILLSPWVASATYISQRVLCLGLFLFVCLFQVCVFFHVTCFRHVHRCSLLGFANGIMVDLRPAQILWGMPIRSFVAFCSVIGRILQSAFLSRFCAHVLLVILLRSVHTCAYIIRMCCLYNSARLSRCTSLSFL